MLCSYCRQKATDHIPSVPANVCGAHAAEFWSGLIAFTKGRAERGGAAEASPCRCHACNRISASRAGSNDTSAASLAAA